jgi:hypothetical protein
MLLLLLLLLLLETALRVLQLSVATPLCRRRRCAAASTCLLYHGMKAD